MDHIGIDVHKRESQICIETEEGEVIEKRIPTERERFVAVFGRRPRARILIEAMTEAERRPGERQQVRSVSPRNQRTVLNHHALELDGEDPSPIRLLLELAHGTSSWVILPPKVCNRNWVRSIGLHGERLRADASLYGREARRGLLIVERVPATPARGGPHRVAHRVDEDPA